MTSEKSLQINLFGAPQVFRNGLPINNFSTNKVLALFCYLITTKSPHTRDVLAGMFWPDMPNTDAKANLRKALSALRKVFPDEFAINRTTVQFKTDIPHTLDVTEFSAALMRAHGVTSPKDKTTALTEAVNQYKGEFLAGFYLPDAEAFSEWALQMREHFSGQMLDALFSLAQLHTARSQFSQAAEYWRRLVAIDPWREEAHRELMLILARMGRRTAAIAQYHACAEVLQRDLGVLPSAETRILFERIESGAETPRETLPQQPTPFVGRMAELDAAAAKLMSADCRMLTIVGWGGVGKTRLAVQLAEDLSRHFLDGIYFVPLTSVYATETLIQSIGNVVNLNFSEQGDPLAQLCSYFAKRETLLLLDNCEQLVDAVPVLEKLLQNTAAVKILLTSRRRMASRWEHTFQLSGFQIDGDDETAEAPPVVELFVQNARRIKHDFTPTPADIRAILDIASLLSGIPLGIELAARWVSTLSCDKILAQIREGLSFLDADSATGNLNAVLEYTWREFSPAEQNQFSRLARFRDPFTADAAIAVAEFSISTLSYFVERGVLSPLSVGPASSNSPEKYAMHQLWRQFAGEKLAENTAECEIAHSRHHQYFSNILKNRLEDIQKRDPAALKSVEAVFNDILSAWEWLLAQENVPAIETLTYHIGVYLTIENRYGELRPVLEKTLARLEGHPEATRARIAQGYRQLGEVYFRMGELPKSSEHLVRTLELLGHKKPSQTVGGWLALGKQIAIQIGHRVWMPRRKYSADEKLKLLEAALAYERYGQILFFENTPTPIMLFTSLSGMNLSERVGYSSVLARLYGNMILGFGLAPVHTLARFYRKNALMVAKQLNHPAALAWVLEVSSIYHCGIGDWARSDAEAQEAIAIAEKLGDSRRSDEAWVMPSYVALHGGDIRRSAEIWFEVYVSAHKRGDVQVQRWGLAGQAKAFVRLGRVDEAISYANTALEMPLNVNDLGTDISCYGLLAEAYLRNHNIPKARRAADTCLDIIAHTSPSAFSSMGGYVSTAWTYLQLSGENPADKKLAERAEKAVAELQAFARIFPIGQPVAAQMAGVLAWQNGHPNRAKKWWDKGLAVAEKLAMPYAQAMLHAELARFLPADSADGQTHRTRAEELCAEMRVPLPLL